jgi:hypothetical protein
MALYMATDQRKNKTEAPKTPESFEGSGLTPEALKVPEAQVESLATPETGGESHEEQEGESGESVQVEPSLASIPIPIAAPQQKDRLEKEIESVLEQDLTDMYLSMTPVQQMEFKVKGEETVSKIRVLLSAGKINAKKIFLLIREWLKIIPGVNKFFLEQEAKIKTDKILLVTKEEQKRGELEL